jgi:hypothetical protein
MARARFDVNGGIRIRRWPRKGKSSFLAALAKLERGRGNIVCVTEEIDFVVINLQYMFKIYFLSYRPVLGDTRGTAARSVNHTLLHHSAFTARIVTSVRGVLCHMRG